MTDRTTPRSFGGERQTLVDFLDYLRESVILKTDGLSDEQLRTPGVPSGTSLLGLLKHLTMVEVAWLHYAFAGDKVWVPADALEPEDTLAGIVAGYRAACARSDEIIAGCDDLDTRAARPLTLPEEPTLRWVLVHMVEETGRHAGHADILRELTDGSVGR